MRPNVLRSTSAAAVLLLLSLTSYHDEARAATDQKSVVGWTCRTIEGQALAWGRRNGKNTPTNTNIDHALMNTGTSLLTVVCPLVRDNAFGTEGVSKTTKIRYKNFNQSPASPLSCSVVSRNSIQTSVDQETNTSPMQDHINSQEMTFAADIDSWTDGYYYVLCDIPPYASFSVNSGIFAINLIENL